MSADDRVHAQHDIGDCDTLEAESVGPPGGRRFRVRASAEHGSALLWLEKEELGELARAIKGLLRTSVQPSFVPRPVSPDDSGADFEFKVHSLALGHDAASDRYMLLAQVSKKEGDAIVMWADRATLDHFADQAFEVHDAGRPRCPLCGSPVTEGRRHVCPRAN
jgi:uncharacterized repeat protein (TIGR03847 family)